MVDLELLPAGYELLLARPLSDRMPWQVTVRDSTPGLSGGSCREYRASHTSPEAAMAEALKLVGTFSKPRQSKKELTPEQQARAKRIGDIAIRLVEGQVAAGTLDANDEAAMEKATKRAVRDAAAVLNAAEEYLSG